MKTIACWAVLLCILLSAAASPVYACAWDRDTLATEAKGLPELPYIITGRFERKPPLFYEMRLKRVTAEIARNPADLNLYDDAGVACDRLGRGDEAVAWMDKKRAQLDRLDADDPQTRDHRYRYYANGGTFLVHRWFAEGKDPKRIAEVVAARDAIAKAIAINPNAHFGRERVQLYAIEWLMNPKEPFHTAIYRLLDKQEKEWVKSRNNSGETHDEKRSAWLREKAKGLAGLVALGNAWESVDIFSGLSRCAELSHNASIEYLCDLRVQELVTAGKPTQWQTALKGKDLMDAFGANFTMLAPPLTAPVKKRYAALRANAEKWHEHRTAFMLARLQEGKHPDTDADFWDGYQEIPKETLDYGFPAEKIIAGRGYSRLIVFLVLFMAGLVFIWWRFQRKTAVNRSPDRLG